MNKEKNPATNIPFCTILTLIFITLRLCNVITWSWGWVLAPLWMPLTLALIVYSSIIIAKKITIAKL